MAVDDELPARNVTGGSLSGKVTTRRLSGRTSKFTKKLDSPLLETTVQFVEWEPVPPLVVPEARNVRFRASPGSSVCGSSTLTLTLFVISSTATQA